MTIELSAQNIITFASLAAAIIAIVGYFNKAHNWIIKQNQQSQEIEDLKKKLDERAKAIISTHNNDINDIKKEQTMLVYGVLACLKGMKEQGCNGPVTEAIEKLDKYLNQKAHEEK